jgi:hypothetical protein
MISKLKLKCGAQVRLYAVCCMLCALCYVLYSVCYYALCIHIQPHTYIHAYTSTHFYYILISYYTYTYYTYTYYTYTPIIPPHTHYIPTVHCQDGGHAERPLHRLLCYYAVCSMQYALCSMLYIPTYIPTYIH